MDTVRLTTAQALVRFLANQYVERDGVEQRFFAGCFGIFGHGNVAGVGQALQQYGDDLTYYQPRNEQAMVHTAAAYARQKNRLQTLACTSSIGPGATNMVTGAALDALSEALAGYEVESDYREQAARLSEEWDREVERLYSLGHGPLPAQSEVIGAVNSFSDPADVVVCAAGSMPGDLHKLWRTRDPKGYHVEYGYSTMGYEIAGGLGVKMAAPEREVYVMVGDGSYLMMSSEIITSIQEGYKLTVVPVDNSGFASIGALSRSVGSKGFGTQYRYRKDGSLGLDAEQDSGEMLPVDLANNAESFGAYVIRTKTVEELKDALGEAKDVERTVVIHIPVDRYEGVPDYESFWDVPVAEVSEMESVVAARKEYAANKQAERRYL